MSLMWKARATCILSTCVSHTAFASCARTQRNTANDILYIIITRKPLRDRFRGVALTAHTIDLMWRAERRKRERERAVNREIRADKLWCVCMCVCVFIIRIQMFTCVWVEWWNWFSWLHLYIYGQHELHSEEWERGQRVHSRMNYAKAIILIAIPPSSRWKIDPILECILLDCKHNFSLRSIYACLH